jgi:hypothetical protein
MGPPLSPRARQIAAAARDLLETDGPEASTMRRFGEKLGISQRNNDVVLNSQGPLISRVVLPTLGI